MPVSKLDLHLEPITVSPFVHSFREMVPRKSHSGAMPHTRVLPSLTPLRGIAAVWVVIYHYNMWAPNTHLDAHSSIIGKGYLAVDLFFMISGFVMTHVYHRALLYDFRGNYFRFLGARIARLYPLHVLILALFLATAISSRTADYVATGAFNPIPLTGARSISAFFANLLMLQGVKASKLSWNYPAWTISIEFLAYLLFPLMLSAIWQASPKVKAVLAAALLALLSYLTLLSNDYFNQWDGSTTLLRCLPEFVLGMLLYSLYCSGRFCPLIASDAAAIGILAIALIVLQTGISDFLTVIVFALLLLAAVSNEGRVTWLVNTWPLVWLGELSYSLYLAHGFVQFGATRLLIAAGITDRSGVPHLYSLFLIGAMFLISFGAAALTYLTVERVGRRRLRRLFGLSKHQERSQGRVRLPGAARSVDDLSPICRTPESSHDTVRLDAE
jgi:peptidoglycan/LPS O-acetylase OafA/YrhL